MEEEADIFLEKLSVLKPWLDKELYAYEKKQESLKEDKKAAIAKAIGVNVNKLVVDHDSFFENKAKQLGLPQEEIDRLMGRPEKKEE